MIPAFIQKRNASSEIWEETVGDIRNIADDLVLFDASGRILAVRTDDRKLRATARMDALFSETERLFLRQHASSCYEKPMLLASERGPVLVFCHWFPSAGFFVGAFLRAAMDDLCGAWRRGLLGDILCSDAIAFSAEDETRGAELPWELHGVLSAFLLPSFMPRTPREMSRFLCDRACVIARLVGCHLQVRLEPCEGLSDAFSFDVRFFEAMLIRLFLSIRSLSVDRCGRMTVFESGGRFFCSVSIDTVSAIALSSLADMAERRRFPFYADERGNKIEVVFSPEMEDISLLGLKNRFIFH